MAITDPGPVAQGFGQSPQLIITQGFNSASPTPPPSVTATTFEIQEVPFGLSLR